MPKNSIYLENGQVWRREQSQAKDPLRAFPQLFSAKAKGRSFATETAGPAPEFEVTETTDDFSLSARVPGITAAQLQVRVTAQLVIVLRRELPVTAGATNPPHAAFRKAFVLPTAVDVRRLRVTIDGALLTIRLPKRAPLFAQSRAQKTR